MDLNRLLFYRNNLLFWVVLLFANPTQTTLFNDIFWASKSTIQTGMYMSKSCRPFFRHILNYNKHLSHVNTYIISGAIEVPYHVIHSSEGIVGSGNYTYYKLNQPGTLRLTLTPLSGDPDIYISEGNY